MVAAQIPGGRRPPTAETTGGESVSGVITSDEEHLARARRDGWERIFEAFPEGERESRHDQLYALLRAARAGNELTEEERERSVKLVEGLDKAWSAYRADALASLANVPEDDRGPWLRVINLLEADWSTITRPALQAVTYGEPLGDAEREPLARLQSVLDEVAFAAVRDDTVPNRPPERFTWFRLFEALGGADPTDLRKLSRGTVGYVQLLKQPQDYRGQIVTIKGTIELGYRVPAFENVEGIKQYYIFWLRPVGGDDSPIVIYSLETPEGFPPVLDKNEKNQSANRLKVPVEIDGYMFKRMAYLSKNGTLSTPLVLARAPILVNAPSQVAELPRSQGVAYGTLAWIVAGTAGFGVSVALFAYFTTRNPRRRREPLEEPTPEDLRKLAWLDTSDRAEEQPGTVKPPGAAL